MPFLPPNQQRQSTEGCLYYITSGLMVGERRPVNTFEGQRRSTKCSWYQLNRERNFDKLTLGPKNTRISESF